MYLFGAIVFFLPPIIGAILTSMGIDGNFSGISIAFAILAKNYYVENALKHLAMADEKRIFGNERSAYLQQAGGVSNLAGAIALAVFVLMTALIFMSLFLGSGSSM